MNPSVLAALHRVFGDDLVREPRSDTPLTTLGVDDDTWIMVAMAIEDASGVVLTDADIAPLRTLGDLLDIVEARRPR